ncbi:unnamed protein product [Aspergillus oryzae]|nr:unnamed protein product [Aspergillus oryzae]GMF94289.1 unnamed protein product [Aspergillus oryzae]
MQLSGPLTTDQGPVSCQGPGKARCRLLSARESEDGCEQKEANEHGSGRGGTCRLMPHFVNWNSADIVRLMSERTGSAGQDTETDPVDDATTVSKSLVQYSIVIMKAKEVTKPITKLGETRPVRKATPPEFHPLPFRKVAHTLLDASYREAERARQVTMIMTKLVRVMKTVNLIRCRSLLPGQEGWGRTGYVMKPERLLQQGCVIQQD